MPLVIYRAQLRLRPCSIESRYVTIKARISFIIFEQEVSLQLNLYLAIVFSMLPRPRKAIHVTAQSLLLRH